MIRRNFAERAMRKASRAAKGLAIFGVRGRVEDGIIKPLVRDFKTMVALLDRAFSAVIIARDKNFFETCPFCSVRPIQCAFHFVTRGKHSVRWNLQNAVGSCFDCNGLYEADDDFVRYANSWFVDRFGQAVWDDLQRESNRIAKYSGDELEALLIELKSYGGLRG